MATSESERAAPREERERLEDDPNQWMFWHYDLDHPAGSGRAASNALDDSECGRAVAMSYETFSALYRRGALASREEPGEPTWQGECLAMVREALVELLGEESMSKTPPMMYPEAIFAAVRKHAPPAPEATAQEERRATEGGEHG